MAYLNSVILDVSIFDIVNAKVRGSELISNGSFKWRVSGDGDIPSGPTHYLYHNCNPCYVWSNASGGPISFGNTSTSITFKAFTTVTKYTFSKTERATLYQGGFTTYQDAQNWLNDRWNNITPGNNYTYDVRSSEGGYGVYMVYLAMTSETDVSYMDTVVNVSSYITELPTPTCTDPSTSLNSASVTVNNLIKGDRVSFSVSGSGNPSSASGTVTSGSSLTLEATGLVSGTTYNYSVSVNGNPIKSGSFTTDFPPLTASLHISTNNRGISGTINNPRIGDTYSFNYREYSSNQAITTTWSPSGSVPSSYSFSGVSNLKFGVRYVASIYSGNIQLARNDNIIFSTPTFSITEYTESAKVTVKGLIGGDRVEFIVGSKSANPINSSGDSVSLTITGLSSNTKYSYIVKVNGVTISAPDATLITGRLSPKVSFSASGRSAYATISQVYPGDNFTLTIYYDLGHPQQGSKATDTSGSVQSGQTSLTLKINDLLYDTNYYAIVSFTNGEQIGNIEYFTTGSITRPILKEVKTGDRQISATLTNVEANHSVGLWVKYASTDTLAGYQTYDEPTSSITLTVSGLEYGVNYLYSVTDTFENEDPSYYYIKQQALYFAFPPSFTTTDISFYSVDVKVSNAPSGAIIRANARNANTNKVDGNYEGKNTEFTISGLTSDTSYLLEVFISDSPLDKGSFKTLSIPIANNFETNQNTKTASIQISNIIRVEDTVTFKIEKVTGTNTYQLVGSNSYTRTDNNSPSTTLTINGLEYDVNYVYTVSHHTGQNLANAFRRPFIIESPIKPSYTIEEGYKRAIINIVDTKNNDTISVLVKKNSTGEIVYNNSNAPNSITINDLTYGGIRYDVVIKVNNEDIDGPEYFYTLTPAQTVEYWPEVKIVAIIISNIGKNDTITLTLTGGALNVNESYTAQADGTVYGWDFEVEWDTDYNYSVDIKYSNGETIHLKDDTFNLVSPKYSITNITTNSFTINVFDAKASSTVKVTAGWMAQQDYSDSDNQVSFTFNDLELGTGYEITVSVADYPVNGKDIAYTLFDWWISTIGQGVRMNVYNNKPSPVKAVEWNKLVDLVNKKKSKSISSVSAGQEMIASSGGNIYQVAEALGVPVASGRVTAQFFLDLKTAINNILN